MKILSFLAQKGGAGKTTLACHVAVEAEARKYGPVFMCDLDPQGSMRAWYERRQAETPVLIDPRRTPLGPALEALRAEGVKLVVVDTPPHGDVDPVVAAASVADLNVIPVRPSLLDVEAVAGTVEVVRGVDRPAAFVINAASMRGHRVDDTKTALRAYGLPVCPVPVGHRVDFSDAMLTGVAVRELHRTGKASAEVGLFWNWIRRRI